MLSVSGQTVQSTLYVLDGIWNENTGNMGQSSVVPNPDSLEEVRVLQNNYSVKYSLMGAAEPGKYADRHHPHSRSTRRHLHHID